MRHPFNNDDDYDDDDGSPLLSLILWILWASIVYSPFFGTFYFVYDFLYEGVGIHEFVSIIAGIIAAFALYMIIMAIEAASVAMKSQGRKAWVALMAFNLMVVCGLPFYLGGGIATELIGPEKLNTFEYVATYSFCGSVLAVLAYVGVIYGPRKALVSDPSTENNSD